MGNVQSGIERLDGDCSSGHGIGENDVMIVELNIKMVTLELGS